MPSIRASGRPGYGGRVLFAVAVAAVLVGAGAWLWSTRVPSWSGPLRIGYRSAPPYYFVAPGREPAGMGVDVLRAAAGRLSLPVKWVQIEGLSDAALRSGQIDIWATLPVSAAGSLHVTEPWLKADYFLVFLEGTPIATPADIAGRNLAISSRAGSVEEDLARRFLPKAQFVVSATLDGKLTNVCQGNAAAALAGGRESLAMLISRPAGCQTASFSFVSIPGASVPHGIGSTLAAARIADRLRAEVEEMAGDGTLAAIHANWSLTTAEEVRIVYALQQARQQNRLWVAGVAVLALALAVALWQLTRNRAARRLAEDHARQQERYRVLFERNLAGVFRTTSDGRILDCNDAFARMLGCTSRGDLLARQAWDFYPDRVKRDELFERLKREGPLTNQEIALRRVDGTAAVLLESATLIDPGNGEPTVCEGTVLDITRQRELEGQYRQAQRLESIGRLAGGVAHDFNNMLTAISGYADLVLTELDVSSPAHAMMQEIQKAAQHAESLTRQLLAFSRRQHLQPRVMNVNRVVTETRNLLRRVIGEDVDLVTDLAPDLANVKADPDQVQQVLMNLAVNARDAMPDGGRLVIATANLRLDGPDETEAGLAAGAYVRLTMTDSGHGMDAATQQQAFEPFFTTKERGKGTGLGLSTVYGVVKQSGGHIRIRSSPGHGTSFVIDLPAADAALTVVQPSPAPVEVNGTETILVVEDQDDVRKFVSEALARCGYRVLAASHGSAALEISAAEAGPIHLILTDVVLPKMAGPAVVASCQLTRPDIKVLYMSGYADSIESGEGEASRSRVCLQKPFTALQLVARVRDVLGLPADASAT